MNNATILRITLLTVIALALVWAIQNAASPENPSDSDSLVGKGQKSLQKSPRRSGSHIHSQTGSRSFEALLNEWQALIPSHGESLFDEGEMSQFLASLSEGETIRLAQHLLSRGSFPKLATARLMGRWGEFDPEAAFAALEDSHGIREIGRLNIYLGWLKSDTRAAVKALAGDPDLHGSEVWGAFTRLSHLTALNLLCEHATIRGGQAIWLTTDARDTVIANIPDTTDWLALANRLSQTTFRQDNIGVSHGPGDRLFARWADHDFDQALNWYRDFHQSVHGKTFDTVAKGNLIATWDTYNPSAAAQWIDNQLNSSAREETLELLRQQIDLHTSEPRWIARAAFLPDEGERFKILQEATSYSSATYQRVGQVEHFLYRSYVVPDRVIEDMISTLEITPEHAIEIRRLLETRANDPEALQRE